MTTVESFQAVAAVGAAAGVVAMLVPGRREGSHLPRVAAALALTVASWLLLVGSLVTRTQFDKITDRLGSPARLGAVAVALAIGVLIAALLVRICIRKPVVWLVLVAIALPIRVPVSLGSDLGGNLLVPLYLVIAVGLVAWAWGSTRGTLRIAGLGRSPLDLPLAAFTAFSLVSIWWSGDVHEGTVKAVFFYVPFVILYRLVVDWWPLAGRPIRAVTVTTLCMAVPIAAIAVAQYATRTIWWNDTLKQGNVYNRFFRANGIFYDPNILGRYLMVALVIVAAYAVVTQRRRDLVVLGFAAAALAAGLAVTFSRSSALGLMVAVTLLALHAFGVRRTMLVAVGALVLIGGPVVAVNSNVRDKVTSVNGIASTGEGRFRLVDGGVQLWKSAPIGGVGLGAFANEDRDTLPRKQVARTRVFISHTAPITVLAELGAIGMGLMVVLIGTTILILWRGSRGDPEAGWQRWTILATLTGIFVHSLLYSAFFEDPYVWMLAAVGVALRVRQPVEARSVTQAIPVITPIAG